MVTNSLVDNIKKSSYLSTFLMWVLIKLTKAAITICSIQF